MGPTRCRFDLRRHALRPDAPKGGGVSRVTAHSGWRRTGLLVAVAGVTAALLAVQAPPSAADHDDTSLDVVGLALRQAEDLINAHHDGAEVEITQIPESPPAALPEERLLVVAQQYTPASDDVGPQHFWSLSLGTTVPDVASLDRSGATQTAQDAGFKVATIPADAAADWLATGSDPPAGQVVAFGTPVSILLTPPDPGPVTEPEGEPETEPGLVVVPDLDGATTRKSRRVLKATGLVIDVSVVPGEAVDAGRVVDQDPAPGSQVQPGSTVAVRVAQLIQAGSSEEQGASGTGLLLPAVGLGVLLLFAAAALTFGRGRTRRRSPVRTRVAARPYVGSARTAVESVADGSSTVTVRLAPHSDRGSQQCTEVVR